MRLIEMHTGESGHGRTVLALLSDQGQRCRQIGDHLKLCKPSRLLCASESMFIINEHVTRLEHGCMVWVASGEATAGRS
jgi:hypothetical protein